MNKLKNKNECQFVLCENFYAYNFLFSDNFNLLLKISITLGKSVCLRKALTLGIYVI